MARKKSRGTTPCKKARRYGSVARAPMPSMAGGRHRGRSSGGREQAAVTASPARPRGPALLDSATALRVMPGPLALAGLAAGLLVIAISNGGTQAREAGDLPPQQLRLAELEAPRSSPSPVQRAVYALDIGDQIKISVYGRDDLSAEYRIDESGLVTVPTVGTFDAAARTPAQLAESIRWAVEQSLQRQAFVRVDVISRQPVFVTGHVAKPGSYSFTPGMTVIHATTVAGGTLSSMAANLLPTEALREAANMRRATLDLAGHLVRRARLEAERDQRSAIAVPHALIELVGSAEAMQRISDEQAIYARDLEVQERQRKSLQSAVEGSRIEVKAFEEELENIGRQRTVRADSLEQIRTLSSKGLTTQQRLTDAQILLTSLDRDAQTAIANISRSRQALERNARDLELLGLDRKTKVEQELQAIQTEIGKARAQIRSSTQVIDQITGLPGFVLAQDRDPEYEFEILRKDGSGALIAVPASDTTAVMPGDVIRVTAVREE